MRLDGTFDTPANPAALRRLATSPEVLAAVPTFTDVEAGDGAIKAGFHPVIALGPIRFDTTITAGEVTDTSAVVGVVAQRGNNAVTADIQLTFEPTGDGARVAWQADVLVAGPAASVGQRVAGEIAHRAIDEVLRATARAAATAPVPA
ncbi:CoxG family protein [Georgenia yuyongxinii]|uniref:Carbon monoxide dehydrogenase subunit G n=1 Tax=Georgenia yuyongxinii TaxID=2589797 RepID=A0A552WUQ2_9MICO|nr:SRPBCC domain-containing protein [Georgenia yuyongxinii]TRW46581.1 hypothetical protein FJ693_04655 [Georgenia yuyongxinii]